MKIKNKKGFTLAEILITLTIIGIIAAILFPSILANYTERTLKAKRVAFIARMSQAMAELQDKFASFEDVTCADPGAHTGCTDNASALKFLSEGLGKTYKLASICDKDSLSACDVPDQITRMDGTNFSLYEYSASFKKFVEPIHIYNSFGLQLDDLFPAAFITKNGESVLVFVNPTCTNLSTSDIAAEGLFCVNMVFDLNGGKTKPNKMGQDIGILTSLYPGSPMVVAPLPVDVNKYFYVNASDDAGEIVKKTADKTSYNSALAACSAMGDDVILPSVEEMISLIINTRLLTNPNTYKDAMPVTPMSSGSEWQYLDYWTSTLCSSGQSYTVRLSFKDSWNKTGCQTRSSGSNNFMCIYQEGK